MVNKSRVPMQVSPEFEIRIKKLQENIMRSQGKNISLRDITERFVKLPSFEDVEKDILNVGSSDFKLNLDRRKK